MTTVRIDLHNPASTVTVDSDSPRIVEPVTETTFLIVEPA